MNSSPAEAIRPVNARHRPMVAAASLVLLGLVLALVLFASLRSPLKDDIAWLLYVAHRWMAGRELYVDVIEVNPPLIVWISAAPLRIAYWLGADPKFVALPGFIVVVLALGWWAASLLKRQGGLFADRVPVFAAIGSVLLLVPASDLGQREHLLVAAMLPYLVLFAGSLDRLRPPLRSAIVAGVLAGLGCALKPRYAGVFVVLEGIALLHGMRPWRALPIAAALSMAGYGLVVAVFCPAYLRRAVPLALALYGATDVPFLDLLQKSAVILAGEGVAAVLLWLRWRHLPERRLLLCLIAFAVTSSVICLVDGKDWFYHRLPANVAVVLALLLWAASSIAHRRHGTWSARFLLAMGGLAMLIFAIGTFQRVEPELAEAVQPGTTVEARLEQLLRREHARTYVALSEWLALGFPVVNNTGVIWASRFDSMWALKGELWRAHFDPAVTREWPVARWVVNDFIAGCPDIAVVDTRTEINYIAVLSQFDPSFTQVWSRYRKIDELDGLVVYKRAKGGCVDPSRTAQWPVIPGPSGSAAPPEAPPPP
jgi:hypothetical protein